MMAKQRTPSVELVSIDRVHVVNPRIRNRKVFQEIVDSIAELGLKRPIIVARRHDGADGSARYDLVCGQGRLEAYKALGQRDIPAIVVEADAEDCMVMSLVENCARRKHLAIDLLYDIEGLKRRGYAEPEIARKIGLSSEYVRGVIRLIERGEHRLLRAVESGTIPVSIAIQIADADDEGVQAALQQAYEQNLLRGKKLLLAKRAIEGRRRLGKGLKNPGRQRGQGTALSSEALLRAYQDDTDRKRMLVRKAEATRDHLVFVTQALKILFSDEHFVTLLRAESLDTVPRNLVNRMSTTR